MDSFMLSTILALATVVQNPNPDALLLRWPAVHGETVVFHYATDLWVGSKNGGPARRLTSHPGSESRPRFSPDGKTIAFTGQLDGSVPQVYVVSVNGGQPRRITMDPMGAYVIDWRADGKIAYTSLSGSLTNRHDRLFLVDPKGGMPITNEVFEIGTGDFSADNQTLVYNRMDSYSFNWRRYRGGTQGRISFYNFATGKYSEMPQGREQSYFPLWVSNEVVFSSDKEAGTQNVYRLNPANNRVTKLTNYTDGDVSNLETDGKTLVYERDGTIEMMDLSNNKVTVFKPEIAGDVNQIRPTYRRFGGEVSELALSPTGARLAVNARGKSFSVPATTGDTRMLMGKPGVRERNVTWSPDGAHIAFMSDESGEYQIYRVPQRGGAPEPVKTPAGDRLRSFSYSPDGKGIMYRTHDNRLMWLDLESAQVEMVYKGGDANGSVDISQDGRYVVYTAPTESAQFGVFIYDRTTKKTHNVVGGFYNNSIVTFDLSGKYLYFTSNRTFGFTPTDLELSMVQTNTERVYVLPLLKGMGNPFLVPGDEEPLPAQEEEKVQATTPEIDFDNMAERVMPMPWGPGSYGAVVGANNGVFVWTGGILLKYDFNSRQSVPILQGIGGISFNKNRTKGAYVAGNLIGIVDLRPGVQVGQGRVNLDNVAFTWDPKAEWKQMYWEAWRLQRDEFYDKDMLGLDWKGIGDKWARLLPSLSSRSDLNWLLGKMVGELGTGHAYVSGGDQDVQIRTAPAGMLGADYAVENGRIRIKRVLKGLNYGEEYQSPLGRVGIDVKDGDYILAIDGKNLTANDNIADYLVDKVGKNVTLTVNSRPSEAGARTVTVQPISNEMRLRYEDWVTRNREYVDKMSNGTIGYIHVPDTSVGGITEFMRAYGSMGGKKAVLVDERYNGGGFLPTFFIEYLKRDVLTGLKPRHGATFAVYPNYVEGPKAMLINNYAGSGGDMLPWLFKEAKIGPLIGTRTWGGLVGISGGLPLSDGGSVTSPAFGIFDRVRGKFIAENTGVDPDIEVDWTPVDYKNGNDPQLKRGVEYLMEQVRKNPVPAIPEPPFPTVKP